MLVERTACGKVVLPPYGVQKRIAGEGLSRVRGEGLEKPKLSYGQGLLRLPGGAYEKTTRVYERVAKLKSLGFGIYATLGTSSYLWNHGIESRAAFRISRGRPNAIDLMRKGEINWVVNTSESDGEASGDSVKMRSAAVAAGIPVTTTLAGFAAAVAGLSQPHDECSVYSLQEYQHKA